MEWVLLLNVASTGVMIGVIWLVQVVHYPLFGGVGRDGWTGYAAAHGRRTTWVVGPPMLVELATGIALVLRPPQGIPPAALWAGLALIAVAWASTALLQVPRHRVLGAGWDAAAHRSLVAGNWLRTAAWTLRGVLLLLVLARLLPPLAG
ncbi:MAG TPA: hypothetical protein VFQ76_07545 [Longimicrobiaceae bacterium]|nr:hypothetical protein [Longimicrobiaceae bacterium]